jgi:hypothetical protein
MAAAKFCTSMYHPIPGNEVGTIELPVFPGHRCRCRCALHIQAVGFGLFLEGRYRQAFAGGREPKLVPISLGAVHEYPSRAALSRVGEMK